MQICQRQLTCLEPLVFDAQQLEFPLYSLKPILWKSIKMKTILSVLLALSLFSPVLAVQAKSHKSEKGKGNSVDCSGESFQSAVDKLKKSKKSTLRISGDCAEDVVVSGFSDLTLIGEDGASISATGDTIALLMDARSLVTVESLTIYGGNTGASCTGRSNCVFRHVIVEGGDTGITVQDQSGVDIVGSSSIQNSTLTAGIGIFGASTVNIRPEPWGQTAPGPTISGHAFAGVLVQDGSFLRTDNVDISDNGVGIFARRGAVVKVFSDASLPGVSNNGDGIVLQAAASAQIISSVTNNSGVGLRVGPLSYARSIASVIAGNGTDIECTHATSVTQPDSC
jgi:hypothetical protein